VPVARVIDVRAAVLLPMMLMMSPLAAFAQRDSAFLPFAIVEMEGHRQAVRQMFENPLAGVAGDTARISTEIQTARKNFWAQYPNGKSLSEASIAFDRALLMKDLLAAGAVVPTGSSSWQGRLVSAVVGLIDNGIPVEARVRFRTWTDALRQRLGATSDNDVVFFTPARLLRAFEETAEEYEHYRLVRDFAEFDAAGRTPSWAATPRGYGIMLHARYEAADMAAAVESYNAMVDLFGAPAVDAAAERVRKLRVRDGAIVDLTPVGLVARRSALAGTPADIEAASAVIPAGRTLIPNSSPLTALRALSGASDSRRFAYWTIWSSKIAEERTWPRVLTDYRRYVIAYGEPAVLAAAEGLRVASTEYGGTVRDPLSPTGYLGDSYQAFQTLLIRAGSPENYARAAIAFSLKSDSPADVDQDYKRLAAIRGESALAAAARELAMLATIPDDKKSQRQREISRDADVRRGRGRAQLEDVITGKLVVGASSVEASQVINPRYAAWAAFAPGASVTTTSRSGTEVWTLLEVTGDRVRVRRVLQASFGTFNNDFEYPRRGHRDDPAVSWPWVSESFNISGATPMRSLREETCEVPGNAAGTCVRIDQQMAREGMSAAATVWVSDQVPGGLVRQLESRRVGISSTSEVVVQRFSGTRRTDGGPSVSEVLKGMAEPSK
jgi:hypothetical protein